MVSLSDLLQQHDKEHEAPKELTKKEKQQLKKQKKKLEKEAKIRKSQEDEMARETKVAQKNIVAYRRKWKEIRMERGRPEFKEYMTEHWCLFDHLIDKKDDLIDAFNEELEHAERTRLLTFRDHILKTDIVINDYNKILEEIRTGLETNKTKMMDRRDELAEDFANTTHRQDENMRLVLFLINRKKMEDDTEFAGFSLTQIDEEVSKHRSDIELLVARTEFEMMRRWNEYKIMLNEYTDYTKKVLKYSEPLLTKVKADDQLIIDQKKKLKTMTTLIDHIKYNSKKEPQSTKLRDLRSEKLELTQQLAACKKRLSESQNEFDRRIQHTLNVSNKAFKFLSDIADKGENILKFHRLCNRYEWPREQQIQRRGPPSQRSQFFYTDKSPNALMTKLWRRNAPIVSTLAAFQSTRKDLVLENEELKQQVESLVKGSEMQSVMQDVIDCIRRETR